MQSRQIIKLLVMLYIAFLNGDVYEGTKIDFNTPTYITIKLITGATISINIADNPIQYVNTEY